MNKLSYENNRIIVLMTGVSEMIPQLLSREFSSAVAVRDEKLIFQTFPWKIFSFPSREAEEEIKLFLSKLIRL